MASRAVASLLPEIWRASKKAVFPARWQSPSATSGQKLIMQALVKIALQHLPFIPYLVPSIAQELEIAPVISPDSAEQDTPSPASDPVAIQA